MSAPASGRPVGPTEPLNLTDGINPAAHSVTTYDGKVITGITFVDQKDVRRIRRQQAGRTTLRTTAPADNTVYHP